MAANGGVACHSRPLEAHRAKSICLMDSISPCEEPEQNLLHFWCEMMHDELKLWSSQLVKEKVLR